MNEQIRQGDVFLQPAGKINLNGAKPVKPINGRLVLDDDGNTGPPQALTARNAVASTFGLTGEEYAPALQS